MYSSIVLVVSVMLLQATNALFGRVVVVVDVFVARVVDGMPPLVGVQFVPVYR